MGMDPLTFLCITLCMYSHVQSLNVKPVLPTISTTFNATVELQWQVTLEPSEAIASMTVRELPSLITILTGAVDGFNVAQGGRKLFGDRVSGIFNNRNNIVTLTLQNIQYNETLTFQLLVGSSTLVKAANISIVEISGSPRVCGRKLKSNYTVNEGDFRNITQDICGYPKPKVSWTLGQENAGSSTSFAVNNATRQYEYHYKTRPFNRSDCGSNIAFIAKNTLGSINGNAWIDVDFVPSGVSIVSIYNNNTNCINVTWNKQETGSCNIKYHLRLNGKATIYNTLDRHFTFCISMKFENVTVWASYKGKNGKMVSSSDVLTTPSTTTTTTTTTTSTRKSKTTTNKSGGQVITNNGNGTNIGLIVGIVGGILFVIIIIIIVVCVLKHKKKNGTGNHSGYSMRVTGGENNYVIDPTRSNGRPPANPDDPEQAIYSELGPGGGRTGPRPAPEQSDYAEMKVDAMGYPIDGAKASEPPTYAPIIKPREGAKRRTPSPPRSNVDGARAAASTEPPTYAPVIKNRSSSRGRSPPPDEDDHEGVIV